MSAAPAFTIVHAGSVRSDDFASAVEQGLGSSPKHLPCRFFYDERGSRLFEEICRLEDYYLPAAEREILFARAEWLARRFEGHAVVELGSGSGEKTEILLGAMAELGPVTYVPLDICAEVLEAAGKRLTASHPGLTVRAVVGEYGPALEEAARRVAGPKLILWLGSNVGNFERAAAGRFLARVRGMLGEGDGVLVGADLRKERALLERAYDDPAGITARFDENLLVRVNRELGGEFDLDRFRHLAQYDEPSGVVRMFLVSEVRQEVAVAALGRSFTFQEGERIHTEDSTKYSREELQTLARAAGMDLEEHWTDALERFSTNLMVPI